MKTLILGAHGMLGQELIQVFSIHENNVVAWDKDDLDITNKEEVDKKLKKLRPVLIINAAAYNAVDEMEEEGEYKANLINGYAPGYIARTAKDIDAIFAHYSTDYVFDGQKENGYKEYDTPNPVSVYGRSKFLGEEEVKNNGEKYYIIRLSRLFGIEGGGKKSFVDMLLNLAKEKDEFDLVDEEIASPTYAPDLAIATKDLIEKKMPFGIYHITNAGSCSWYGFGKEVFAIAKKNVNIKAVSSEVFPRPAKRPAHSILINTKLPPLRSWQEALSDYVNHCCNMHK